jgi:hypothetical protein
MLFPGLPPEEGWAKIDAAFAAASDERRVDAIEALASGDLDEDLLELIRRLGT